VFKEHLSLHYSVTESSSKVLHLTCNETMAVMAVMKEYNI